MKAIKVKAGHLEFEVRHDPSGKSDAGRSVMATVRTAGAEVASVFAESPEEFRQMLTMMQQIVELTGAAKHRRSFCH